MAVALPVDPFIPQIQDDLRTHRAVIVVAAPGTGKTTRVPPALTADGPVILLQPRRVAARSIARRIAAERAWTIGREVGWQVRSERRFTAETQLLVATEGILTARLQQYPLLTAFRTIVLDEFHERSVHADLGIALAKQAWRARDDLRIVIMSATLDARRAADYLDGCPVRAVPGLLHPVAVSYRQGQAMADAVREALAATEGQVLCFEPGAAEVRRTAADLRRAIGGALDVVELHGSLPPEEQDRALEAVGGRRAIVATNIAETSLTVPGVRAVIDSGLHKVARYDAERGVDSLSLERISLDSADQRAGRAGRLGPGFVRRLWSENDRLRPHREPDIARIDLAGPVLDILAWGGDPRAFDWFEPPPRAALEAALSLLRRLGALEGDQLTPRGRAMGRLVVHPRLARILDEAGGGFEAAVACAVLSERHLLPRHPATTSCDLLAGIDNVRDLPPHVVRVAEELQRAAGGGGRHADERTLRRALLAGYPDRVAKRRAPGDPRVLLATGHGARIGDESGVRDGTFVLALDVTAGRSGEQSEARIRIASIIEPEWLAPDGIDQVHTLDAAGVVRAVERERYGALTLSERAVAPDPLEAAALLVDAFVNRPLPEEDDALIQRLRFASIDLSLRQLAERAAAGRRRLDDVRLAEGLDWETKRQMDERAPATFVVPSGRTHRLEYRSDGTVVLSVKLQELFGLADTPVIGVRREPLLIVLLAPNGRPVQTTRDLHSFWNTTYQEVRKELRGRYPRHPWPEDPWSATPTARTKRAAGTA